VVTAGVTTTLAPDNAPGFHVYVAAPAPLSVVLPPVHRAEEVAVAVTVSAPTLTVTIACAEHPVFVPVTVYVVVDAGPTVNVSLVCPVFHEYVPPTPAPLAVKSTSPPGQIPGLAGVTEITGVGLTVIIYVTVSLQPPLLPTTVYVVFEPGETVMLAPDNAPGCHV